MFFDRYDIMCAYYLFYSENHWGQGSEGYRRLCRLQTGPCKFRPSPIFGYESLSENAKEIYENLIGGPNNG